MSEINTPLWQKAILEAIEDYLYFGKMFYSKEKVEVSHSIGKHKYFAFRVEDIAKAEAKYEDTLSYAKQAGRGLVNTIEKDIITHYHALYKVEDITSLPGDLRRNKIVFYFESEMRVQAAYDIDYLATSIVGDVMYRIGVKDDTI